MLLATYGFTVANLFLWGYFVEGGFEGVIGLYERGYFRWPEMIIFVVMPVIMLSLSLVVPIKYRTSGKAIKGFCAALIFFILVLPFGLLMCNG